MANPANAKSLPARRRGRLVSLLRLRALRTAQPVLHLRYELLQQLGRLVRLGGSAEAPGSPSHAAAASSAACVRPNA